MPDFKTIMLLLSAALGLSLGIERLLEGVKRLIGKMLMRDDDSPFVDKSPPIEYVLPTIGFEKLDDILDEKIEDIEAVRAEVQKASGAQKADLEKEAKKIEAEALELIEKFKAFLEEKVDFNDKQLTPEQKAFLLKKQEQLEARVIAGELDTSRGEYDERFSEATVIVDRLTPRDPEKTAKEFWLQVIGTLAGVLTCYFSDFGLFNYLLKDLNLTELTLSPEFDTVLTGVLIGGGSAPIHTLIKFLTDRKVGTIQASTEVKETDVKTEEAEEKKAPAVITSPVSATVEIDIPYNGGVDKEKLENFHLRGRSNPKNPNLIIYHHTAMHSDTTFADVVRVIKDKDWVTGYNCVILKDGSIHPFCRWDRYGNHAKGFNLHSLGIALNGNFETNPKVPFANVNGSMGIPRPTNAQLLSACKVVALWCHLYDDIKLDFKDGIIPHKQVNPNKACPGANFPYDKFKELVTHFYTKWEKSEKAQEERAVYEQKQYLYV